MKKRSDVKIRQIDCPYCGIRMKYRGANRIQLGRWGVMIGHMDHLFAGSLNVQIYECMRCGKIEMFRISNQNKKSI